MVAAAAASIASFLRPPPRESWRTRAVAEVCTSSTLSPRASSHWDRCRPKPPAPSTAQRRCGHRLAHVNSLRYSDRLASIRIVASGWLVTGSTAVAV